MVSVVPLGPPSCGMVKASSALRPGLISPASKEQSVAWKIHAVLLLAVLCISIVWTVWLITLTVSPNETVNSVMSTGDLDYGMFWLLPQPNPGVAGVGVAGLALVLSGYLVVLYRLVSMMRSQRKTQATSSIRNAIQRSMTSMADMVARFESYKESLSTNQGCVSSRVLSQLMDRQSHTRHMAHTFLKFVELGIQVIYLAQLLNEGLSVGLVVFFAVVVSLNAFVTAILILQPSENMGSIQAISDAVFDLAIALIFPLAQLFYAFRSFTFSRGLMSISNHVFPSGFFETYAAVIADPVEITRIRHMLNSLRIDSVLKIFTRVGANASFGFGCTLSLGLDLIKSKREGATYHFNLYPRKHRHIGAILMLGAAAIVVFTEESIRTSAWACAPHLECVQHVHRWINGTYCPCLAVIDRNLAVATYEEWTEPKDLATTVAQLSISGDLQTLQLVNRRLITFPEEMRRCTKLKHVSLYYTETVTLPKWFSDFTKLQFLHIEGKHPAASLSYLPDGIFEGMASLTFIHIAGHALKQLPSLDGIQGVISVAFAMLPQLQSLPALDKLTKLERLTIVAVQYVQEVPDMANLQNLKLLVTSDRGAFCCNGFLGTDRCNLTHSLCLENPTWGAPAITECLPADRKASPATRAIFDTFRYTSCAGEAVLPGQIKLTPRPEEMVQCQGRLYKQCSIPGYDGPAMCYNARWMPVACDASPFSIEMRRQQIAKGVGQPCDPEIEAWLGCA